MFQRFLVWIAKLSGIKTLKRTLSVDQLKENINKACWCASTVDCQQKRGSISGYKRDF